MDDFTYLIFIAAASIIATMIVSFKKRKKVYKYLPSLAVLIGSIIYCVIITIMDYNRYIGIGYVIVFMTTVPAIVLSLVVALIFDITQFFINRYK